MGWEEVLAEIDALVVTLALQPPPQEAPANPFGLSRRERDVLTLLASGQSNRDIAAVLHLSHRTVEHHVQHILAKLDVQSRAAAAALAVRLGLD
jgi:DNA-binding NarL/FixJ family response regulator